MITYSASATDENYCMELLWIEQNADLLDASNWHKLDVSILTTNYDQKIFGPDHNSLVL